MRSARYDAARTHREVYEAAEREALRDFGTGVTSSAQLVRALRLAEADAQGAADDVRKARRNWAALRRKVLAPDSVCRYCGDEANELDHLLPYSRGGADELHNVVPACSRCNFEKLDFTVDEWRAWRLERGWSWPPESRLALIQRVIDSFPTEEMGTC